MVPTNLPFGKKSSVTIVNEACDEEKQSLVVHRDDFWASTSSKQLNFLQHVFSILKQLRRAAIVVPHRQLSALTGLPRRGSLTGALPFAAVNLMRKTLAAGISLCCNAAA